jgi:hypothetical protein
VKELRPTYPETDWQSEITRAYSLRNRLTEWKNLGLLTQKQTDRVKELGPTYSETDWQSERTQVYLLRNRMRVKPWNRPTEWKNSGLLTRNRLTEWKNLGLLTQKQTGRVKELRSTYSETEWGVKPWNRPTEWKNSGLLTRNRLTEWKNSDLLTQKQIDRVKELRPTYSETDWQNVDLLTQKRSRWQSREYSKLPYTNLYSVNVVSFKLWGSAVCVCKYSP